jgi:hypothetical protein
MKINQLSMTSNKLTTGCFGLALLGCIAALGAEFKSILQRNDVGKVTVQKVVGSDGTVDQWYNYLFDENDNRIGLITLDSKGQISGVSIQTYRSDKQVEVTYNFTDNFTLRQRWVHHYDADGNWQHADIYDKTGRKSGKILSRPSGDTKDPKELKQD